MPMGDDNDPVFVPVDVDDVNVDPDYNPDLEDESDGDESSEDGD